MPLYPYQRAGAQWLADRGERTRRFGLLADGMGLGKSATTVAVADLLERQDVTIVCPAIMVAEWCETFARFGDFPRELLPVGARDLDSPRPGVLVASYERAQRPDVVKHISDRRGIVVFDECHYLKDPGSKRTQRLFDPAVVARADRVVCLSGTPIPNHAGELFPIFRASGLFRGDYESFVARYCVTRETEHGFQVLGHRNVGELRQLLGVLMLRRMHQIALPPTDYREIEVDLSECDTRSGIFHDFRRIAPAAAMRVGRLVNAGNLAALEHAETATERRLVGCLKAVPVARRAANTLDRDKANKLVIFCLHTDPIALLANVLRPYGVVEFTGATPKTQTKRLTDRFQNDSDTRVALCQWVAAGVGITLTAANYMIGLERPWSPAVEDQGTHRIIRIGQRRPTHIRHATLRGSIDEAVNRVLQRKATLISEILH